MLTIHAASEGIRQGRLSPRELLEQCLERVDQYEDRVRAWVFIDRDYARAEADRLTNELRQGRRRGPLHGIPIGIKDIMDVFDWPTAAGSKLWAQSIARQDAPVVRYLRQAGAVLMGKTVTTQYASFDPPPTRNPWNLDRTPGGSSSGAAAAVACGMCLGATASQTGGSITRPASYCGVAGYKPSFGRVPLDGILPLAHSMDHPGPIASSVRDLSILLEIMTGSTPKGFSSVNYGGPGGTQAPPRVGRLHGLFDDLAEPAMQSLMERVTAQLREHGAVVVDVNLPAGFSEVLPRHRTVMAVEAASFHELRLRRHPEDYGPNITKLLEEGLSCPAPDYARCKEHQRQLTQETVALCAQVDILLAPATTGPAPDQATTGNPAFNSPWSYTGLPAASIPAGWTADGLPLAIQLIGHPAHEDHVLAAAEWCERVLAWEGREPPWK
jgi:aspartyl-tRNA(Asn)/glutamyl-tRNA(Gln) amidotransferase subunit A